MVQYLYIEWTEELINSFNFQLSNILKFWPWCSCQWHGHPLEGGSLSHIPGPGLLSIEI